jgi:hypothetical protein
MFCTSALLVPTEPSRVAATLWTCVWKVICSNLDRGTCYPDISWFSSIPGGCWDSTVTGYLILTRKLNLYGMHPVALPMIRYRHTQCIYTRTHITCNRNNNIDFISFNPLTTCSPSSGDYSNILCIRIKNHHITTSHPFLTTVRFTVVLFRFSP